VKVDKRVERIASIILADYQYLYDPRHEKSKTEAERELGSTVHETSRGWGTGESVGDGKGNSPVSDWGMKILNQTDMMIERHISPLGMNYNDIENHISNLITKSNELLDILVKAKNENSGIEEIIKRYENGEIDNSGVIGIKVNVIDHGNSMLETEVKDIGHIKSIHEDNSRKIESFVEEEKSVQNKIKGIGIAQFKAELAFKEEFDRILSSSYEPVDDDIDAFASPYPMLNNSLTQFTKEEIENIKDSVVWASSIIDRTKISKLLTVACLPSKHRCGYNRKNSVIVLTKDSPPNSYVHELGHHIECSHPDILKMTSEFYNRRTRGNPVLKLNSICSTSQYGEDEEGKDDKFIDKYTGKIYPDGTTEILSMGLEHMYYSPMEFRSKDPEHFELIINILNMLKR
jgi:hypothetical protein